MEMLRRGPGITLVLTLIFGPLPGGAGVAAQQSVGAGHAGVEVTATVRQVGSRDGIPDVEVRLDAGPWRTTDGSGRVDLGLLRPGPHVLDIQHVAFGLRSDTMVVGTQGPAHWIVEVDPEPIAIDPVVVTATSGRTARMLASGRRVDLMTRADIDRRLRTGPRDVAELMVSPKLPFLDIKHGSFRFSEMGPGREVEVPGICIQLARKRGHPRTCSMVSVYVNGVSLAKPELSLVSLDPHAVETIEVLTPEEASLRFGTYGVSGGVVVITLRSGGG